LVLQTSVGNQAGKVPKVGALDLQANEAVVTDSNGNLQSQPIGANAGNIPEVGLAGLNDNAAVVTDNTGKLITNAIGTYAGMIPKVGGTGLGDNLPVITDNNGNICSDSIANFLTLLGITITTNIYTGIASGVAAILTANALNFGSNYLINIYGYMGYAGGTGVNAIGSIPSKYAPAANIYQSIITNNGLIAGVMHIDTSGNITCQWNSGGTGGVNYNINLSYIV
jgi:hypothetical protein